MICIRISAQSSLYCSPQVSTSTQMSCNLSICPVCWLLSYIITAFQGNKRRPDELPPRPSAAPEAPKRQHVNLPQLQQRLSQLVGRPLSDADMSKITGLQNYQALADSGSDYLYPLSGRCLVWGGHTKPVGVQHGVRPTTEAFVLRLESMRWQACACNMGSSQQLACMRGSAARQMFPDYDCIE